MKRNAAYIVRMALCVWTGLLILSAQAENVEHENILHVHYGGMWQQDQYLSPLLYSGMGVGIGNEWWQAFRVRKGANNMDSTLYIAHEAKIAKGGWEHMGRVSLQVDWLLNTPKTNRIYALGVQGGWGAYYAWKWTETGLQVGIGPYVGFDFMPRYILSNVNKPYSMDVAAQVEAMGFVSYAFAGRKTSYRLRYLVRANLVGIDFMPDYWQSYYELSEGVVGKVRCAGMWNHRYLYHELTLDMQFRHSTWRVGVRHEYLEYGEQDMRFSREQVSAVIGTCFRYRTQGNKRLTNW